MHWTERKKLVHINVFLRNKQIKETLKCVWTAGAYLMMALEISRLINLNWRLTGTQSLSTVVVVGNTETGAGWFEWRNMSFPQSSAAFTLQEMNNSWPCKQLLKLAWAKFVVTCVFVCANNNDIIQNRVIQSLHIHFIHLMCVFTALRVVEENTHTYTDSIESAFNPCPSHVPQRPCLSWQCAVISIRRVKFLCHQLDRPLDG